MLSHGKHSKSVSSKTRVYQLAVLISITITVGILVLLTSPSSPQASTSLSDTFATHQLPESNQYFRAKLHAIKPVIVVPVSNSQATFDKPIAVAKPKSNSPASPTMAAPTQGTPSSGLSGSLSCSQLGQLWLDAGGSPSAELTAEKVAMAESGGNQYALSPSDDYGYWQINASHGPEEATFNPIGNARAAIAISNDGSNWSAWTTYTSGTYEGFC